MATTKKGLTLITNRVVKQAAKIHWEPPEEIAYQHSVLCQISLPYRNPGDDMRLWQREQGAVSLLVEAGRTQHPNTREWIEQGLPYGCKPRLIMAHINTEVIRTGERQVDMYESLTAFVRRIQEREPNGRELRAYKDQLTRLAVALIRMAISKDDHYFQVDSKIVAGFDVWWPKNHERVVWPERVVLSQEYYNSLAKYAVPLDKRALSALANNAMALDIYTWLAQRLHRIPKGKPQFIAWARVKEQFGAGYAQIRQFRHVFVPALGLVLNLYPAAHITLDRRGLTLRHSLPPVPPKTFVLPQPESDQSGEKPVN